VVAEFAKAMGTAGLPHSFYYSLKDSYYLNAIGDKVRNLKFTGLTQTLGQL
jgi:hypothetical protein